MKRNFSLFFSLILIFGLMLASCQNQPSSPGQEEPNPIASFLQPSVKIQYTNNYVVKFSSANLPSKANEIILRKGAKIHAELYDENNGYTVVKGLTKQEAEELKKVDGVESVARDIIVQWVPDVSQTKVLNRQPPSLNSHDPSDAFLFDEFQWNMKQIDADDAWAAGAQADPDVLVGILDTGINPTHPDLAGRVNTSLSRTFVTSSPHAPDLTSFDDFNFHGTHVAGIVTTNGIGTAGVAPHATVVAIKVLNAFGFGSFSDVIDGILYAASIPVDVINMSLGAVVPTTPENKPLFDALKAAIRVALNHGVYVVASAGNDAINLDTAKDSGFLVVPAQSEGRVARISATAPFNQQNFDGLASYSNFGAHNISVAAPGGDFISGNVKDLILSPCSQSSILVPVCQTGAFYLFVAGTSQAAPHVSGAAALLDSRFGGKLSGEQIKRRIEASADDLGNPVAHGHGRLNVFKMLFGSSPN